MFEALVSMLSEVTLAKTDGFYHPISGKVFHAGDFISCTMNSVMHMLEYPCGLVYVGIASCQFKQCVTETERSFS